MRLAKRENLHLGPLKDFYQAKHFDLRNLVGISDDALEIHFKIYERHIQESNGLKERIDEILRKGKVDQENSPSYSELKRQLGFETNGIILHEYYFESLKQNGNQAPPSHSLFFHQTQMSFGSFEAWKADFIDVGKTRGVGWAICLENLRNGRLSNHWIPLLEIGSFTGFKPLLVMDAWEHSYLLDYPSDERPQYIDAFFFNIDWERVESRLSSSDVRG